MTVADNPIYSTLEVVPNIDLDKQVVANDDKQVVANDHKQVVANDHKQVVPDDGKQKLVNSGEIEPIAIENSDEKVAIDDGIRSRRYRLALISALAIMVIVAAIIGGVLGSNRRSNATGIVSHSPPNRSIAALSFASNSINNTRVYFQDESGQIVEAANSANDFTWIMNDIGFEAKNASALAAAVSRPGFPIEISVFYLDGNNKIHDSKYNFSTGKWSSGILSHQNYTAISGSGLAAMYSQCRFCANTTVIVFQDENGFVQIGNHTSAGWTLSQLGSALDPANVTTLALAPHYVKGYPEEILLFSQQSNLNMSLSWWRPAGLPGVDPGWVLGQRANQPIPYHSPIAAASSYISVPEGAGHEIWVQVLTVSTRGVQVNTRSGFIDNWVQKNVTPPVMTSTTTNSTNPKVYGSVAVTAIGNAFGIVKQDGLLDRIENWQLQDDMVNWKLVGDIDVGHRWQANGA